ncbi:MAG: hybrid-cluster NAD(P)-dependent oxidoreductase [Mesorhizobium sp.]|uniref:hybrid-cluster NAD(P)-dependent oxidoreductase n=2 Tax=Mesorhizobium sp. TaxID=1871066 RepID=UPI000FE9F8AC|nr:hybrid-cluster NAD(P)-dependent oxidoreductase [Mesorhizobium sp.]RWN66212.1 MAG: hybrid-cluster NAD(P)-dependent oxidoreductase [Mesorhizobium sp.]RWO96678.1 MAG: hybrid-cluster NAD(P)-dependent oxidoreductase [Mesorhizobium sp.]RWP74217.1 MAG: hybrid-cluster NAD(P)-dependent oxidoreductase [Mesorhizobium sp.]RWQ36914.1 MAG: hybrid-cluster NAD(P)-dependent oxidoreductase [Mesorhizobium sp.]TIL24918.1 MAG: hybrid-cluster NAD(P)-dependent oxidoreductase [Mesorhizobium sp.]
MMNAHIPFSTADFALAMRQRQWAESARQFVRCRRVIDETHDVRTFVFSTASGHMFSFSAGQYLILHLTIDGATVTRSYSVSSPPTRPLDLQITVKRVKGGLVSNWLHDNLRPGHDIEIEGPVGRFNFDDLPCEKPLFLSGGSGITPVMSMLRALTDRASGHDIRFIHCARTADDIAFRAELEALAARFSNVNVSFICSQEGSVWQGPKGRIDGPMLLRLAPDLHQRTSYVCGPEPFMQTVRTCVAEIGIAPSQYHEESFGGAVGNSMPLQSAVAGVKRVRFARSGAEHLCAPEETLLDAARNCGLHIPTACQQGICGTCRTVKLSGEVAMDDLGGLSLEEKAAGYVLACCSRPQGTVCLDL